jgi:hypothetical protein
MICYKATILLSDNPICTLTKTLQRANDFAQQIGANHNYVNIDGPVKAMLEVFVKATNKTPKHR